MLDNEISWLLDCEPRPAQIEALHRSYRGVVKKDHKDAEDNPRFLPHAGGPAGGWGHFMQMRVGKTPTVLNEFMLFKRDHGINKMLVVAPARYRDTWATEIQRFGVDVPAHVHAANNDKATRVFVKNSSREGAVLVANYQALVGQRGREMLGSFVDNRTMVVFDESVALKNPNGVPFRNGLVVAKECAIIRELTGLPAPQSPADLWSQLRMIRGIEGVNFFQFRNKFCVMGGFKGKQVLRKIKNAEALDELLDRHTFRAKRVDWGTMIDSDYDKIKVGMLPAQIKAYNEMEKHFVVWLDSETSISVEQVITKHMKMQQIAAGFVYTQLGEIVELAPLEKTPKFLDLKERLDNELSCKVIVIAHYSHTVLSLHKALGASHNAAIITGQQHMKHLALNAEEEKHRFNNDPGCRVMIGQSTAIKYGHTLMGNAGDPCLAVCFFENNYNLDDRLQSEERPQGEGQQGSIYIWDYYTNRLEEDIVRSLQEKKEIAGVIMGHYRKGLQ